MKKSDIVIAVTGHCLGSEIAKSALDICKAGYNGAKLNQGKSGKHKKRKKWQSPYPS